MNINFTDNQLELLKMALRYCELNHPEYKKEYTKLLNDIETQLTQFSLFTPAGRTQEVGIKNSLETNT